MKKILTYAAIALCASSLLSGCILGVGSGARTEIVKPTVGQQLIDLKKALDAGAMNPAEYEAKRAEVLKEK